MDLGIYAEAVIHLAWFRDEGTCHFLFAMVELRPAEFPASPPCLRRDFRSRGVGRKRNQHLHYQRFTIPVSSAIDWVRRTAGGNAAMPHGDANPLARISHKPGRWSHIGRRSGGFGDRLADWRRGEDIAA